MVRPARPDDAEAVLALLAALGRPAVADDPEPQRRVFLDHLRRREAALLVAEVEGVVAAVASFWVRPRLNWTSPEGWIPDLYVHPAHRRRGLARALLDACVERARRRGCHRVVLESGHGRREAHRLYQAYGFQHVGRFYELLLRR